MTEQETRSPNQDMGFANQLSGALIKLHQAGGLLLVFIFAGLVLLLVTALNGPQGFLLYVLLGVGALLLIVPMAVVWIGFMRPVMELQRELDAKRGFIEETEHAILNLTRTVRVFSDEIISNHESVADALKLIRPYLDPYPMITAWIDGTQDLSGDLVKHALDLRDAAHAMEVAVSSGDGAKLRNAIAQLASIADRIAIGQSAADLAGRVDKGMKNKIQELQQSTAFQTLDKSLTLAMSIVGQQPDSVAEGDILGKIGAIRKKLRDSGFLAIADDAVSRRRSSKHNVPTERSATDDPER